MMREKWAYRVSLQSLLFLLLIGIISACSDESLSLFFDIPPPTQQELAAEAQAQAEKAATEESKAKPVAEAGLDDVLAGEELEPAAIEAVATWEQAQAALPKDDLDEVDWSEALRQRIIKPRASVSGAKAAEQAVFKWDFFFPGPNASEDTSEDAYFPHSTHTEWVACESCHTKIFPYRELEITMDRVFEGEYCGKCHGPVAFPIESCSRCHLEM